MKVNPYLIFDGNCEKAINFYKEVFSGSITSLMRFSDGFQYASDDEVDRTQMIMHVTLTFDGGVIMASDNVDGKYRRGTNYYVFLSFDTEDEGETYFNKLANEGRVLMPYEVVFWKGKFGKLTDKFGVNWMISGGQSDL